MTDADRPSPDDLVLANLKLAWWAARAYVGLLDPDDAVQIATVGLRRAAELWRPDGGAKFSTFAVLWMRSKLRYATRRAAIRAKHEVKSTDLARPADDDRGSPIENFADEGAPTPEDEAIAQEAARRIRDAVAALPDDQRRIVERTYFADQTLEAAAAELGVSSGAAHAARARALARLRDALSGLVDSPGRSVVRRPPEPRGVRSYLDQAKDRGRRRTGYSPAPAEQLKRIRDGTTRAAILKMMSDGVRRTVDEVAAAAGVKRSRVFAHAHCLARDVGVGFRHDEETDSIEAMYPDGKGIGDVLRAMGER